MYQELNDKRFALLYVLDFIRAGGNTQIDVDQLLKDARKIECYLSNRK